MTERCFRHNLDANECFTERFQGNVVKQEDDHEITEPVALLVLAMDGRVARDKLRMSGWSVSLLVVVCDGLVRRGSIIAVGEVVSGRDMRILHIAVALWCAPSIHVSGTPQIGHQGGQQGSLFILEGSDLRHRPFTAHWVAYRARRRGFPWQSRSTNGIPDSATSCDSEQGQRAQSVVSDVCR